MDKHFYATPGCAGSSLPLIFVIIYKRIGLLKWLQFYFTLSKPTSAGPLGDHLFCGNDGMVPCFSIPRPTRTEATWFHSFHSHQGSHKRMALSS